MDLDSTVLLIAWLSLWTAVVALIAMGIHDHQTIRTLERRIDRLEHPTNTTSEPTP